jgi:hypothetical protein
VFDAFGGDYLRWYLENGALIQLVISGLAIGVDLERYPLLISCDPNEFVAEVWEIAGTSFLTFSGDVRASITRSTAVDPPSPGPLDFLFAVFFYVAYLVAFCAWTVLIAPLQYLGNLVAGAPVRLALASAVRIRVARKGKVTHFLPTTVDTSPRVEGEVIGLARKPVAATALISAGILYAVASFVPGG